MAPKSNAEVILWLTLGCGLSGAFIIKLQDNPLLMMFALFGAWIVPMWLVRFIREMK